jgi:preprotein translocase subunit SecD
MQTSSPTCRSTRPPPPPTAGWCDLKPEALRRCRTGAQAEHHHAAQPVNELGVAEPVIQQQGLDRIVVQLPGVQDTAKAKDILGRTATLEMRMVDDSAEAAPPRWAGAGALRRRATSSATARR